MGGDGCSGHLRGYVFSGGAFIQGEGWEGVDALVILGVMHFWRSIHTGRGMGGGGCSGHLRGYVFLEEHSYRERDGRGRMLWSP